MTLTYDEKDWAGDTVASTSVISEDENHKLHEKAFHWSNMEQPNAMQRCTCFIGFSCPTPICTVCLTRPRLTINVILCFASCKILHLQ